MTAVKKFMFDLDFDAEPASEPAEPASEPEPAEPEAPPEPQPVYTEADLEAARADAYQQGYDAGHAAGHAAGREDAETEADAAAREALTRVAQGIDRLGAELDAAEARRDREALEFAVTMVRRLFPEVQRRYGLTEVENLLQHTLTRLRAVPHVVVRAHPDTLAHLENRAEALAAEAGYDGKLRFVAADDMAVSDVAVTWSDGSARRDTAGVWADIDAAVRNALGDDTDTKAPAEANADAAADGAEDVPAEAAATPDPAGNGGDDTASAAEAQPANGDNEANTRARTQASMGGPATTAGPTT